MTAKLIFIPLDDRPCCRQFVQRLAAFRKIEVLMPPRDWMGNLKRRGDCERIWQWFLEQPGDCPAIVSLDMLAWGGLVGSRCPAEVPVALQQLVLGRLRKLAQRPKTYAFTTVMRVAPTQKTALEVQEAGRLIEASKMLASRYTTLSDFREAWQSGEAQNMLREAELNIVAEVWEGYLKQRNCKHSFNTSVLEFWKDSKADSYLLVGYDDCQTQGLNLLEGAELRALAQSCSRIGMTTGTDELAQLLLARAVTDNQKVNLYWSNSDRSHTVTLYEDCSLRDVLLRQSSVANASLSEGDEGRALLVWTPYEERQRESCEPLGMEERERYRYILDSFISEVSRRLDLGQRVVVADVAYANGGDRALVDELISRGLFGRLDGYAGWNTAGNTLGTALATTLMLPKLGEDCSPIKRFLLERLIDDCCYEGDLRSLLNEDVGGFFKALSETEAGICVEKVCETMRCTLPNIVKEQITGLEMRNFSVSVPWNRLFEVEINVELC